MTHPAQRGINVHKLIVPVVGTLALIMAAGCGGGGGELATPVAAVAAAEPALTVTNIVDGDTVDLSDQRRVRLLGIDTPERGDCGFEQASEFARTTLFGRTVQVEPDPTQDSVDQYGRALLYVGAPQDYSIAVTRAGWAKRYVFNNKPVQKDPQIQAAEQAAQAAKTGIWSTLCVAPAPPPPPAPTTRQAPPPVQEQNNDNDVRRPAPAPAPPPPPPPAPREEPSSSTYYKNCTAARAAGAAPVHRGDPGYGSHLDRDGDGTGCE
jgi:endonuclease YncB( thermonuclease family)